MSLSGKTIAITRSANEALEFVNSIEAKGGNVITLQAIDVMANSKDIACKFLSILKDVDPDYSAFLSSKSVKTLFDAAKNESIYDEMISVIKNTIVVAVGPRTKSALEEFGIRVAHMPENYSSIGLGEMFTTLGAVGKKIIMPRSEQSKSFLKELLVKIGLQVTEVITYKTGTISDISGWKLFSEKLLAGKVDCIAFTSASSVRAFFDILENIGCSNADILNIVSKLEVFTIGPQADDECKRMNMKKTHISNIHTVQGLADEITSSL